jgi:hypothetical protein
MPRWSGKAADIQQSFSPLDACCLIRNAVDGWERSDEHRTATIAGFLRSDSGLASAADLIAVLPVKCRHRTVYAGQVTRHAWTRSSEPVQYRAGPTRAQRAT